KEKCRECKVLPICMGGCPYENMKLTGDATICNPMKFNITKILQIYYDASKKIQGKNHGKAREFEQKREEQNKK
ncbi:SPASM domain-containing protein, partial [Candidatus Calescamantes bacterium]|nr:SPASM domain-containing protein [Candidatus Calescamantes bacterium]